MRRTDKIDDEDDLQGREPTVGRRLLQVGRQRANDLCRVENLADDLSGNKMRKSGLGVERQKSVGERTSSSVILARRFFSSRAWRRVAESETPRTCPVVRKRYETAEAKRCFSIGEVGSGSRCGGTDLLSRQRFALSARSTTKLRESW